MRIELIALHDLKIARYLAPVHIVVIEDKNHHF